MSEEYSSDRSPLPNSTLRKKRSGNGEITAFILIAHFEIYCISKANFIIYLGRGYFNPFFILIILLDPLLIKVIKNVHIMLRFNLHLCYYKYSSCCDHSEDYMYERKIDYSG